MRSKALLAVGALMALSGCATKPVPVKMLPPVDLIAPTQQPAGSVATNGGIATLLKKTREALAACNRDKADLQGWADQAVK